MGQEKEAIPEQSLNVTQSPNVCMNSACARAADGCMELHTVAEHNNEQHRSRARQGEWRVKNVAANNKSGESRRSRTRSSKRRSLSSPSRWIVCRMKKKYLGIWIEMQ